MKTLNHHRIDIYIYIVTDVGKLESIETRLGHGTKDEATQLDFKDRHEEATHIELCETKTGGKDSSKAKRVNAISDNWREEKGTI
jgi:hypothetical protein